MQGCINAVVLTLKRYKKLRGYDTYMLTGADEHGQKIQEKAQEKGITPQAYVDEMAKMSIELWDKMNIKYDDFIRTTEQRHKIVAQKKENVYRKNGKRRLYEQKRIV